MEGLRSSETLGISALMPVCPIFDSFGQTGQSSVIIDNDEDNCITDSDNETAEEEFEDNN